MVLLLYQREEEKNQEQIQIVQYSINFECFYNCVGVSFELQRKNKNPLFIKHLLNKINGLKVNNNNIRVDKQIKMRELIMCRYV